MHAMMVRSLQSMHLKYKQTDNWKQRGRFTQTIPMLSSQNKNRSKSSNSKTQRTIQKSPVKGFNHHGIMAKIGLHKQPVKVTTSLKSRYDELVNRLFIMIDFDCTGYITYTKVSYCKEISEEVFYFFGGVFQQIKYLGAVTMKMFNNLCQQVYLQVKKEDIETIVIGQSKKKVEKTSDLSKNQLDNGLTIKFRFSSSQKMKSEVDSSRKGSRFSTKKIQWPLESQSNQCSRKIKTESTEEGAKKKQCYFKSEKKIIKEPQHFQITELKTDLINRSHTQEEVQHVSFQSDKIRVLTQRLDTQIQRNKKRLFTKKGIFGKQNL